MSEALELSTVAAAIGEPARARMLGALLGGQALTATELALEAGVAPSTASAHLARLKAAGLVALAVQGRHRYFRLSGAAVAALLERLLSLAPASPSARPGPTDPRLRRARVCYDHLAGELGVALLDRLQARGLVHGEHEALAVSADGERWLRGLGVDVPALRTGARPLARACLDWSERRDHLAGAAGAALLSRLVALRLVAREPAGRALEVSPRGERFLATLALP